MTLFCVVVVVVLFIKWYINRRHHCLGFLFYLKLHLYRVTVKLGIRN